MTEFLVDRLVQIEEALGINSADTKPANLDVSSLRKKLHNLRNQDGLKTDFIMKVSNEKLRRLSNATHQPDLISMKEKVLAIDFARELMLKRVELLEELKHLSDVAFKSEAFTKIPKLESILEESEKELQEALEEAAKYNEEIHDFYNDYLPLLSDIKSRVEEIEHIIRRNA